MKNKKIILLTAAVLASSILMTGCFNKNKIKDVNKPGIENNIDEEKKNSESGTDVQDEVKDDFKVNLHQRTSGIYTYQIKTEGDTIIQTGMPYLIEKLNEKKEWESLDLELMFTMQLVIIDKDNPFEQDIDVNGLEIGKYRVSKSLLDAEGNVIEDMGTIEFEIIEEGK